eukprot:1046526-Pelagomonas_calceolata.AAC.2
MHVGVLLCVWNLSARKGKVDAGKGAQADCHAGFRIFPQCTLVGAQCRFLHLRLQGWCKQWGLPCCVQRQGRCWQRRTGGRAPQRRTPWKPWAHVSVVVHSSWACVSCNYLLLAVVDAMEAIGAR